MSIERIPMSREGYEKLKADLDRMQNIEMIEVTKRIATARAHGDLSENAEYHAAREDQGMLQARIEALKDKMSRGFIVDRNNHLNSETVAFGMRVVVNRTLCESNAVCARLVPEVFLVDDDDRLQIKQEQPPAALRERVEHAVRRCPKLALSIVDD